MGEWLKAYGEAIYGTRPWKMFGEGPTKISGGSFQEQRSPFTTRDVRFTTKGKILHAIFLAPPKGEIVIRSLAKGKEMQIARVSMVESGAPGRNMWDVSMFKNFVIKERPRFQFRAEAYNLFNHANFHSMNTSARFDGTGAQINAAFGQLTATAQARTMQLALRVSFR